MRDIAKMTILFAFFAVSLAFSIHNVNAAPLFSGIKIISPTNSTFSDDVITLNVTADTIGGSNILFSMSYTLDDSISGVVPLIIQYPTNSIMIAQHNGSVVLPTLSEGEHKITVYANYTYPIGTHSNSSAMESSYYNSTVLFTITTAPTLTPSPSPTWLTIDLADHNYMNNVLVGESAYFSAVVSNGIAPYTYQWKYRPYYVGTAIGDLHPTGDWIEGATTRNFTLTANSTGFYLVEVKVWDSAGAQGLFMSLPPGIWVNVRAPTPSPAISPTLSPSVTQTSTTGTLPSTSQTPSPSPSPTPTESPALTPSPAPTIEPNPTPNNREDNFAPLAIVACLVITVVVVGLLVYFNRIKK